MAEDIDELRELIEKNIEISQETHRMVRKMRRTALFGWFFQAVWWLAVAGITSAAYYYYAEPYIAKIESLYGFTQSQSRGFNEEITNLFAIMKQQRFQQTQSPQTSATTTPR